LPLGPRMLPVDPKAFLVSLWIETFLFGLHLVLFIFCVWILLRHKREGYAVLLTTAICIIAFSTTHVVLNFRDSLFRLHLEMKRERPGRLPGVEVENPHQFFGLNARSFAYLMNNFFADALVVYRSYALLSSNAEYLLALPALLVMITTMVGVADANPYREALQLRPSFFVMSLFTNLTVTALAVGRLYWLSRDQDWHAICEREPALFRRYRKALMIIIESGSLYSLTLMLFLLLCLDDANEGAAMIVQSSLAQIMGIVPTSIIVIVGLGKEFSESNQDKVLLPRQSEQSVFGRIRTKHGRLEPSEVMNIV
jgi:hypothetical protein